MHMSNRPKLGEALADELQKGFELYETDGTLAHTALAYDAEPGPASSHAQVLGRAGDKLIFN